MNRLKNLIVPANVIILLLVTSCQQDENEQKNKIQTINVNDELLNKGNLVIADEVFTAEYAGRGPEIIKEFVQQYRNSFPDLQVSVDPIIAEGNMTGWRITLTDTFTNELNGIQHNGRKISWKDIDLSRKTDDGKKTEEWGVSDLADM